MKKRLQLLTLVAATVAAQGQFSPPTPGTVAVSKDADTNVVSETVIFSGPDSIFTGSLDLGSNGVLYIDGDDYADVLRGGEAFLDDDGLLITPAAVADHVTAEINTFSTGVLPKSVDGTPRLDVTNSAFTVRGSLGAPSFVVDFADDVIVLNNPVEVTEFEDPVGFGVRFKNALGQTTLIVGDDSELKTRVFGDLAFNLGGSIYFGAEDTTLTRSAPGVLAVDGVDLLTEVAAADITDATATGQAALTAADAAALRDQLGAGIRNSPSAGVIALRSKLWGIKNNDETPRISILAVGDSLSDRPGIAAKEIFSSIYPDSPANEPSSPGYYVGGTLSGGATLETKVDYALNWIGTYFNLPEGGQVSFSARSGQILRIPYITTSGGGTLRVQVGGVDEPSYDAIDTSAGGEGLVTIVLDKGSVASRSITLISDTGTCKVLAPIWDFTEATGDATGYYSFGAASWAPGNYSSADARMASLIEGLDVDVVTVMADDGDTNYESFLPRIKAVMDAVETSVGVAPMVVIYGQLKSSTDSTAAQNRIAAYCAAEGWIFVDAYAYAGNSFDRFAAATAWEGDGTHYAQDAQTDMLRHTLTREGLLDYKIASAATTEQALKMTESIRTTAPDNLLFALASVNVWDVIASYGESRWTTSGNAGFSTSGTIYAHTSAVAGNEASIGTAGNEPWSMHSNAVMGQYSFGRRAVMSISLGTLKNTAAGVASVTIGAFNATTKQISSSKGVGLRIDNLAVYGITYDGTTHRELSLGNLSSSLANAYPRLQAVEIHCDGAGNYGFYFGGNYIGAIAGPTGSLDFASLQIKSYNGADAAEHDIEVAAIRIATSRP